MSKWIVKKKSFGIGWRAWPDVDDYWAGFRYFRTWREAMDYADRMSRTREVVLPRIKECGNRVPGALGIRLGWEYMAMDRDALAFWVEDEGSDFIHVQPDELRPLALALLAMDEEVEQA